jgi:hypothetical protein
MRDIYRSPQVEEGRHNIILQNRCGNRLSVLFHEDCAELELVYKPNAFRRKEFRARNFSSRDNFTRIFADARLPEIRADFAAGFDYDPFVTRVRAEAPSRARNAITFVNLPDENAFAIAASCPLALALRPHAAFDAADGLLTEHFTDRGEEIVSFVAFAGFEANRYRVLDDGRHVIQIMDDEVVLIGAEENAYQVHRLLGRLRGLSLARLIDHVEEQIAPALSHGRVRVADPDWQRVIDLNRRIIYSGIDEGGACFGALNRIYHLIWARDGAMTAHMTAGAGDPEIARLWTPLVLDNPSAVHATEAGPVPEFLQMVGSRWTKSEDDGLFYAVLSLYSAWQASGDDSWLRPEWLRALTAAVDHHTATRWSRELKLYGSDTRGETTLAGSEMFGYDAVNGSMASDRMHTVGEREISRTHSLYHNVNMYNVFRMMEAMLAAAAEADEAARRRYRESAGKLEELLETRFVDAETGCYYADFVIYADGGREWLKFAQADYWEYAWAVSVGPFFPSLRTALRSARMVRADWPGVRSYGYCPWNVLARQLREFGIDSGEFVAMLSEEVADALKETEKYPMRGALTEYQGNPDGWRALPFSAGTLINATCSLLLRTLPQGLAVRGSAFAESVAGFKRGTWLIDVTAEGEGDGVASAAVNGESLSHTLQMPESMLRAGRNAVRVTRGSTPSVPRLAYSDARLFAVAEEQGGVTYRMASATRADLIFESLPADAELWAAGESGESILMGREEIEGTGRTVVTVRSLGEFTVTVRIAGARGDSRATPRMSS